MNKKIRLFIGLVLSIVIIIMCIYAYVNREVFFSNKVTIEYPDNCVEIYINNEMVSPECTVGRKSVEEKNKRNFSLISTPDIGIHI